MSFLDKTLRVFPSYGREYKNKKEMLKDWNDKKDFQTERGQYFSRIDINDIVKNGIETVYIEINNKTIYIVRFGSINNEFNHNGEENVV